MIEIILNALIIIIGIGGLIFVHELGHFIVAKRAGVRVDVFSLGFGPSLFKYKPGETEYKLCLIPLGGYVKLPGESQLSEDRTGADYEFMSKPPLTRMRIFAAGGMMNFISAFPLCICAYLLGLNFVAPIVGSINPDSSEWESNIQVGDVITYVNNEPIASLDDYRRKFIRTPVETPLEVTVNRNGQEIHTQVIPRGSTSLGIKPRMNIIARVDKNSLAERAGLRKGDELLEIDGEYIASGTELNTRVQWHPDKEHILKVRNADGQISTHSIKAESTGATLYSLALNGLDQPLIGMVKTGSPAALGGIEAGDRIVSANNTSINSWNQLVKLIKNNAGVPLKIVIVRSGKQELEKKIELEITPIADPVGKGRIGIVSQPNNIIGEIPDGSPAQTAGLLPGDIIIKANQQEITSLGEIQQITWQVNNGKPIELTVQRNNHTITTTITPLALPLVNLGLTLKPKMIRQKYPLTQAIVVGTTETIDLIRLTFQLMRKLVYREESTKGLAGPIGIIQASYYMVQEGISKFLWLLALLSISLGIFNLLPIPILDGGGMAFSLIEAVISKIKGKPTPINIKVIAISQYIGLALLLTLVVYVTYNDIFRVLGL